ncbi:hypothetical protein PFISCL1PPCAC_130, partial [Pristionchus fissidentatus]
MIDFGGTVGGRSAEGKTLTDAMVHHGDLDPSIGRIESLLAVCELDPLHLLDLRRTHRAVVATVRETVRAFLEYGLTVTLADWQRDVDFASLACAVQLTHAQLRHLYPLQFASSSPFSWRRNDRNHWKQQDP